MDRPTLVCAGEDLREGDFIIPDYLFRVARRANPLDDGYGLWCCPRDVVAGEFLEPVTIPALPVSGKQGTWRDHAPLI